MRLIFETHATSLDNEAGLASGWFDVDLSPLGETQALELGTRYLLTPPDAILTSDLRRTVRTAELAFPDRLGLIENDARLRECHYGEWTRRPASEVQQAALAHLAVPFPGGESYLDCVKRIGAVVEGLRRRDGVQTALIIGHRATYYTLEHLFRGVPLADAVGGPWRWQAGWSYVV